MSASARARRATESSLLRCFGAKVTAGSGDNLLIKITNMVALLVLVPLL